MNVIELALTEIKPYWRNPRDNLPAIEAVKTSIERYGFNVPLIVDLEHVLIAGHTRYKALMELGRETAPCVVVDLPKQKAKEYRIADNKTAEFATWNLEHLLPELREIKDIDAMSVYFPEYDLSQIMGESAGQEYRAPSQVDIDTANSEMHGMFEERSRMAHSDYVRVSCPYCTRDFHLSRDEMSRQESVTNPDTDG